MPNYQRPKQSITTEVITREDPSEVVTPSAKFPTERIVDQARSTAQA